MKHINIGCGETKLEYCINIDMISNEVIKPDLICDVRKGLPFGDNEIDTVFMIHALEHIEMFHWKNIFDEFRRVLVDNGTLILAYPEFSKCAERFIKNTGNQRAFWRNTLYGRQLFQSDYHVVPMHTDEIKDILETHGFYRIRHKEESPEIPYNTELVALKDPEPNMREDVLTRELHLAKP